MSAKAPQPFGNVIQRYPRGLVSALDLKDRAAPNALGAFVDTQFDATELYLAQADRLALGSELTVTTLGDHGTVTIPQGELWIVRQVGYSVTSTVTGGLIRVSFRAFPAVPGTPNIGLFMADSVEGTLAVNDNLSIGWTGSKAFPPGSRFAGRVQAIAGTIDCSIQVLAHVLSI